jgi:hypothetical protein
MEIEEMDLSYDHLGHLNLGLGHMVARDEQGIEYGGDVVATS